MLVASALIASGIVGLSDRRVNAAGSPAPTVSILRNTTLAQTTSPGDFNGDGIMDLAATAPRSAGAPPSPIVVSLGNGIGTFKAPLRTTATGHVLAVADFNRDGKADLLAVQDASSGTTPPEIFILLGNGNGTFTTRWRVANAPEPTFGLAADMDGDGTIDVIIDDSGGDNVTFYSNAENGTFPDITALPAGLDIRGGVIADFNHDGCPDLAIASYGDQSLTIFHCQGHYAFTTTSRRRRSTG